MLKNKQLIRKGPGSSQSPGRALSDSKRSPSVRSQNSKQDPKSPNKSQKSFKIKNQSPQVVRTGVNNLGRRPDRSNSRDHSYNRSAGNKSLNDSIEERRKRVLGVGIANSKGVGGGRNLPRSDKVLPGYGGTGGSGKNYLMENKKKAGGSFLGESSVSKKEAQNSKVERVQKGLDDRLAHLQSMLKEAKIA